MKNIENALILKNKSICNGIYDMIIKAPAVAENASAGQFVEIYTDNGINILPRPISICEIDKGNGTVRLVYQVVGVGTRIFSQKSENDYIRVLGPLGNGYDIKNVEKSVFVGGGIGVPPLLEAAKQAKGEKIVVLGFRSESILREDFEKLGAEVYIATDNGKEGFKGNVVELMKEKNIRGDIIYSCGPKVMLKALSDYAESINVPCMVSMEERMACGIGACVGCVVKIKEENGFIHKKVCKDGPVFDSREVLWND